MIIDVLEAMDSVMGAMVAQCLAEAGASDDLMCNAIVFAELARQVVDAKASDETLANVGFKIWRLELDAAFRAGKAFRDYRRRGGDRASILSDFLIGAQAAIWVRRF